MKKPGYRDPRGRHMRVYVDLMDCMAYRTLSWPARALFHDLRASLGATNNGDISATLGVLKHRGWTSPTTLSNALCELQALGFIRRTRAGGVEHGSKVCSLYAFTDVPTSEQRNKNVPASGPTHDYLAHSTLAGAEAAKRVGVEALHAAAISRKRAAPQKKTTLHLMKRHATESGAVDSFDATENGADILLTLQKMEQRKRGHHRAATRAE